METTKKNKTYLLVCAALMAAVLCILAPLSLPIGPVPISLATLVVYLMTYVLGSRMATVSCLVYLLIGLAGLPVFSGFSGGPSKLFGPTGGYLIGYLFAAFIGGLFIEKFPRRIPLHILGLVLGTAALYFVGTCWLAFQLQLSASAALAAGVLPFLLGDALKIAVTVLIGPVIRNRLTETGLLAG